jgi:quinol monooxygenase YgiN
MLGIVATLKVKPGMEAEFEALTTQLVAQVRAHELMRLSEVGG